MIKEFTTHKTDPAFGKRQKTWELLNADESKSGELTDTNPKQKQRKIEQDEDSWTDPVPVKGAEPASE